MSLLRELFYVAACNNFTIQLVHVPGKHNPLTDALSRKPAFTVFCSCPTGRIGPHIRTHSVSQSLNMDLVSLIHRALAGSTTSTYKVGIQRYPAFCKALDLAPVPSTKHQVALFAIHLSSSLRLPTIRVYLAAVSFLHYITLVVTEAL